MRSAAGMHCPEAFDSLRRARGDTLGLVEDLSQAQLDASPEAGRWSIGEVLDHLVRSDEMFLKEIRTLADRQRRGRAPLVYRGLGNGGGLFGSLPWPLRLPVEGTVACWNLVIPAVLRRWAIGQRQLRAQAPKVLRPRARRSREALFADLRASLEELEGLENADDIDLSIGLYYSPILGFNTVPGLIRLAAQHERRHQGQILEAREALP